MTLSEYLTVLNNNLGYLIDKTEGAKKLSKANVLKGFLLNMISPDTPEDVDVHNFNPL